MVDYASGFAFSQGELYFSASNGADGRELWKLNVSTGDVAMLKDINSGGDSSPVGFGVFNNILFFMANDGVHGQELWKSNGTADGTVMVKDVLEGQGSGSQPLGMAQINMEISIARRTKVK